MSTLSSPTAAGIASAFVHGLVLAGLAGWAVSNEQVRFAGTPHVVSVSMPSAATQSQPETLITTAPAEPPAIIEPPPVEIEANRLVEAPSAKMTTHVASARPLSEDGTPTNLPLVAMRLERRDQNESSPQPPAATRPVSSARASHRRPPSTTLTASTAHLSAPSAPSAPSSLGLDPLIAPSFSGNSPPRYPEQARRMGWQGTVLLRLTVAIDGRVTRIEIAKSSGFEVLDAEALRAVQAWRGRPASRAGQPMETVELLPVTFRLRA